MENQTPGLPGTDKNVQNPDVHRSISTKKSWVTLSSVTASESCAFGQMENTVRNAQRLKVTKGTVLNIFLFFLKSHQLIWKEKIEFKKQWSVNLSRRLLQKGAGKDKFYFLTEFEFNKQCFVKPFWSSEMQNVMTRMNFKVPIFLGIFHSILCHFDIISWRPN